MTRRPGDPGQPPVEWMSPLAPFEAPQYLPGSPHNLPSNANRPRAGTGPTLIGGMPSTDAGGMPGQISTLIRDPHHYANIISLFFAVDVVSFKFLDQNTNLRNFLSIRNASPGAQVLFVDFGKSATTNSFLRIAPNQIVLFDMVVPQDDLFVVSDIPGGVISFGYSTIRGE